MMWKTVFILSFLAIAVYAQDPPHTQCPWIKCQENCKFYKHENGCKTCECIDPCKDVICGQGKVCREFRINANHGHVGKCVDPSIPLECQYPPDPSICRSIATRWYYNTDMQTCQQFSYGGCLGNANNFHSRSECARKCIVRDQKPRCPEVMCAMYCETGFQKSADGCDICKCREKEVNCNTTALECTKDCPHGYLHRMNHQGCPTCECSLPNQCPMQQCNMYCQFGFKRDYNGCETCQCMENPCANRICSSGEVCETIPICSPKTHNHCFYHARCSDSYIISKIRVQMAYEHYQTEQANSNELLKTFAGLVKEKLLQAMDSPDASITFTEVNPEKDIFHVTLHVSNQGHNHLVPLWHTAEGRIRNDMKHFVIVYHGHVFTPQRNSLVTSYFSRDLPPPPRRVSFMNIIAIMACVVGISATVFMLMLRARRMKKPTPPSKRINVIYKQAPDSKPLV